MEKELPLAIMVAVYRLRDKKPEDGDTCWVHSVNNCYCTMQVYNDIHQCWDTSDGDDYDFDLNDEDLWMKIPNF